MSLTDLGLTSRNECALGQPGTEVTTLRVCDDFALIVMGAEALSDEFVEPKLLGAGNIQGAIQWRFDSDFADRFGDVVRRHRLDQHRR